MDPEDPLGIGPSPALEFGSAAELRANASYWGTILAAAPNGYELFACIRLRAASLSVNSAFPPWVGRCQALPAYRLKA